MSQLNHFLENTAGQHTTACAGKMRRSGDTSVSVSGGIRDWADLPNKSIT